jgi:GNAT superfamily N-acetyltransferase
VQLERFDAAADPGTARLCYDMYLAARPADDPRRPPMSARAFAAWLALGWSADHPQAWLARDAAGRACGWYSVTFPERENTHLAVVIPLVAAGCRRRGLGTGLVRHAAGQARDRGRTLLVSESRAGSAGEAFCRELGARPGISEASRVLRLAAIPAGQLARLRAQAQASAAGYRVLSWTGPAPERYLAQLAALVRAADDAPRDEGREDQHWDPARVRESAARITAQGLRHYTVAARCERTGELAGMTQLGVDPLTPDWAYQELTVVARPHRGHRLGLLVKVAMLELLAGAEPQLAQIFTGNADRNSHMIAINTALGFQVLDHWRSWELAVAAALAAPLSRRGPVSRRSPAGEAAGDRAASPWPP